MQTEVILEMATGRRDRLKTLKAIQYGKDRVVLPNGLELMYPNCRAEVYGPQESPDAMDVFRTRSTAITVENASFESLEGRSKLYGGLMTENVVQALARIVVADSMVEIAKEFRVVMMTHDEVVYMAPEAEGQAAYEFGQKIMSTPPAWAPDLPLAAEGGFDVCYSK